MLTQNNRDIYDQLSKIFNGVTFLDIYSKTEIFKSIFLPQSTQIIMD